MPWLWANLAGVLIGVAGSLVGRVLLALGIGAVSYTGIHMGLDAVKGYLSAASAMVGQYWWIVDLLQISNAITILTSAITFKWMLAGASPGGALYKWKMGAPAAGGKLF